MWEEPFEMKLIFAGEPDAESTSAPSLTESQPNSDSSLLSLFLTSSSTVSGSMFANVFRSMWYFYFDVRMKIESERTTYKTA